MKLKIGDKVYIPSNWSITKQREEVTILNIDSNDYLIKIEYSNSYIETLPLSSIESI